MEGNLIGIGKSAHTREDTENVVIHRVYADDTSNARWKRKHRSIDTGHIERSTGLMLLGFEGERIDIDTLMELVGGILVVLIGLDEGEIITLASREAVIAVKHYLSTRDRVGGIEMVIVV